MRKLTFGYGEATRPAVPEGVRGLRPEVRERLPLRPREGEEAPGRGGRRHRRRQSPHRQIPSRTPAHVQAASLPPVNYSATNSRKAAISFARTRRSAVRTTGRDSAAQTLTAHFGPNGPLNLSTPYEPAGFEEAVAKVRQTPLDSPDYAATLQAATRAGLQSKALVFTYASPNLFAKTKALSALPKIPAHRLDRREALRRQLTLPQHRSLLPAPPSAHPPIRPSAHRTERGGSPMTTTEPQVTSARRRGVAVARTRHASARVLAVLARSVAIPFDRSSWSRPSSPSSFAPPADSARPASSWGRTPPRRRSPASRPSGGWTSPS
ncbi:hypothetical protein SCYAM73S_00250 [Streptomyces cyaneofuscatus]